MPKSRRDPRADAEQRERAGLQHAAEHVKSGKRNSVLFYLAILFAAAFLLLLMSYMMQQRANQEALDDLQQTSNSAVQSLDNLIAERDALKEQAAEAEAEMSSLQAELAQVSESAQQTQEELDTARRQRDALQKLNQIRTLYNQRHNSAARALLEQWEAEEPGGLEDALADYSVSLSEEELAIYDPLAAYQKLVELLH